MICTEQERDALMAAATDVGRFSAEYGMAFKSGDLARAAVLVNQADERLTAIRAMLAPPDDAGREEGA